MDVHNHAIIINFQLKRELGKVSFRIAITSYIVSVRYTVYHKCHGSGIVRDTLKNVFVRIIDERTFLVHFSY